MNLLAIIVVFLAIAICVAIAYIAWELSSDKPPAGAADDGARAKTTNASSDPPAGTGHES